MFNFLRRKKYCPFCEQTESNIITLSYEELDKYNFHSHQFSKKRTSKIKLIINEDYRVYECTNCNTFILVNGRDFIRVNEKINIIKHWYKGYSNIREDFKITTEEIGFSRIGESSEAILPCKIRIGKKEQDFVTLVASKYFPILQTLYFNMRIEPSNYFFVDNIDELCKSDYAISKEIRNAAIKAKKARKNFFPTILEGPKNQEVLIEGLTLFFNSQNIIGSNLRVSKLSWTEETDYLEDFSTEPKAILLMRTKNEIDNKNFTNNN